MKPAYRNDDMTFCANRSCPISSCDLNPMHRTNQSLANLVAAYENSKFCPKNPKNKEWKESRNARETDKPD